MSDFIFARKTSNLILLCPAKSRKPTEHLQVTLNPLAVKGTIAEKPLLRARTCSNIRICPSLACHLVQETYICQCFWQG